MNSHYLRLNSFVCSSLPLLVFAFPSRAAMASSPALEDQLFGSESASTSAQIPAAPSEAAAAPKSNPLMGNSETLTLGGRLELTTLIQKNSNKNLANAPLVGTSGAELFLDARPNDELRGFIKGSISNRGLSQAAPALTLYETWLKWSGSGSVYTTLGRQKLKWGAGSIWNPTDFFALQPKDPFAFFDVRPGANLLKVHVPFEKSGNNFYALANFENVSTVNDPRIAARSEFNFGFGDFTGELTTTVAGGRNQPRQFGLDLSTALGPIDVVVESAWTHRSNKNFYRVTRTQDGKNELETFNRKDSVIQQLVAGANYTLKYSESDSAIINVEYFWNDFGSDNPVIEAISFLQGQAQPLYLAHRYLGTSIVLDKPGPLNESQILLFGLWNMADNSWRTRLSWNEKLSTKSSLIVALGRSGGAGEFTGGIPKTVADEIRKSNPGPEVERVLSEREGQAQEWELSLTAGIDL